MSEYHEVLLIGGPYDGKKISLHESMYTFSLCDTKFGGKYGNDEVMYTTYVFRTRNCIYKIGVVGDFNDQQILRKIKEVDLRPFQFIPPICEKINLSTIPADCSVDKQ